MTYAENGDSRLSSFTRRLWMLTYSCLYKYECPVIFTVFGPDAPRKTNQYITFFVPALHPNASQVIQYLKEELQDDQHPEQIHNGEFWPGTNIEVLEYSGVEPYLERQECRKLAENMAKSFMEHVKTIKGAS
jgi:hypothetical protein